jgi:hypothetical protein
LQFVKNYEKENKEKWFFTVAEEAILVKGGKIMLGTGQKSGTRIILMMWRKL